MRQRREKIASNVEPVWRGLYQALKDSVAAYAKGNQTGRFEENGKNHHVYWVRYLEDTPNPNTEKTKVIIELDAETVTIKATYDGVPYSSRSIKLELAGGDVCLRAEKGDNLLGTEAAAYLLDPFLFPDLAATNPLPGETTYQYGGLKSV